jgi:enhancer of polycomb-like protein
LQGVGVSASREIPVPPPEESKINYEELYVQPFELPNSYIRFSQTVEECIGCQYDMTEEDDVFLKSYNQKRAASAQLSEDDLERMMEVFEDTTYIKTPFASVDQTIVPYDDMVPGLQQLDTAKVMPHAKELYEYWKSRRQALSNHPLQPSLKFERHQDSDEMDPYVCFRRREVRLTRKTRARDVQSADKLKRLRRELEDGRQLIIASHEREVLKKEMLNIDRIIFEQRAQLKEAKVRLGIKTDDEDLVNQKVRSSIAWMSVTDRALTAEQPQKRKAVEPPPARPPPPKELRLNPVVSGSRPTEHDLPLLADKLLERENELRADIEQKIRNHNIWNQKYVDLTRDPLPPVRGEAPDLSFRPAKTQYLMTPPASASNESMEEPTALDLDKVEKPPMYGFRGVSHDENPAAEPPAYRRRIGRLNRLWIDRRGLASPPCEIDMLSSDRWKYDQDSEDEGEQPVYEVDPFDTRALKFRASVPLPLAVLRAPKPNLDIVPPVRPGLQPPQQQAVPSTQPQQVAPQRPPPPAAPTSS